MSWMAMEFPWVIHDKIPEHDKDPMQRGLAPNVGARSNSVLRQVNSWLCKLLLITGFIVAMGCGDAQAFNWGAKSAPSLVLRPIEVLTRSSIGSYAGATLGLCRFRGPSAQADTTEKIAQAYMKEFLKTGIFKEVKAIPQLAQSEPEAVWLSRKAGCDLLVSASVLYVLGGSGALPTQLQVDVRIMDARLGKVVWHFQQSALSEPGRDSDFFWSTRVGAPAHGLPALAEALASQLSAYLVDPTSNP